MWDLFGIVKGFSTSQNLELFSFNLSKRIFACVSGGVPIISISTNSSEGLSNSLIL